MKRYNRDISYFAFSHFRTREYHKLFGYYQSDRVFHTYILGKTGTGKTNLLTSLILQDIQQGRGICVFDIHGDLIQTLGPLLPKNRKRDLIHLDITNRALPFRYNPLKHVPEDKRSLVASSLIETFHKMWKGAWGLRMEHLLRYIILLLLDQPQAKLSDIFRIINDEDYRKICVSHAKSKIVRQFFTHEFDRYGKNDVLPILNKLGALLAHPPLRRFFIDNPRELSLRQCMDNGRIVLVDISKGKLGGDVSHTVGAILLNGIMNAGFSRVDTQPQGRRVFHVFLDEFHNYTNPSIVNMLSEIRKWNISLTMANQYLSQLDSDIRNAVLGNVGTTICFRLGQDASYMEKEFYPIFKADDFVKLENYDIYLKLMIHGKPSQPFSATTPHYDFIMTLLE